MPQPPSTTTPDFSVLASNIVRAFGQGRVVPFLGAGASLIGRINSFVPGTNFPTGGELADHLATQTNYPSEWEKSLTRVSQFMSTILGTGPLYDELRNVFLTHGIAPNPLHQLLATLTLRQKKPPATVIVTTNYDTLVEDALKAVQVPFDILTYTAREPHRGRFRHTTSDGTINEPADQDYNAIPFNKVLRRLERPLVLKIHGTIAADENDDSFVITEEDYIDYLARTDVSRLLPTQVAEILAQKHFLFLGYSLADWNLRVLLSRVWQRQKEDNYRSWAANRSLSEYDRDFWRRYGVDCHRVELGSFAQTLAEAMDLQLGPVQS